MYIRFTVAHYSDFGAFQLDWYHGWTLWQKQMMMLLGDILLAHVVSTVQPSLIVPDKASQDLTAVGSACSWMRAYELYVPYPAGQTLSIDIADALAVISRGC